MAVIFLAILKVVGGSGKSVSLPILGTSFRLVKQEVPSHSSLTISALSHVSYCFPALTQVRPPSRMQKMLFLPLLFASFTVVYSQCACSTASFPPTSTPYSMISGDAGCVINYLEVFDNTGSSIYSSGNASSRVGPFEITCPGSTIASFSFHCNDGSVYPLSAFAALNTISSVQCSNGAAATIVGENNVCRSTSVGTIGPDPTTGTCSKCASGTWPGTCSVSPCTTQSCSLGPSPFAAPWPMMGQDPAHRSTSPYNGPQSQPSVAWSEGGGAYDGITIGNDGTVYSSISLVNLLTAYNGMTGQILWTTLNSGNGSSTYTVGPSFTLFGNLNGGNTAYFSQLSGALEGYLPPNGGYGISSDITIGTDYTLAMSLHIGYFCVLTNYLSQSTCVNAGYFTNVAPANVGGYSYVAYTSTLTKFVNSPLAQAWAFSSQYGNVTSPSISIDGARVFTGTSSGYALSVSVTSGAIQWAASPCPQACGMNARSLPVPSSDGTKVFFPMSRVGPTGYAGVVALSATSGATQWTLSTNGDARSLALDSSGILYVGDANGAIFGVHASSGAVVWTQTVSGDISSLAIGANSFLYVATNTSLVALH